MAPMDKAELIAHRLPKVRALLESCLLCGHRCGIDRTAHARGACRTTSRDIEHARCASYCPHFGEEPMLVGRGGSGTVFLSHCNLRCVFCQNHQISQDGLGEDIHYTELAERFLRLQAQHVENINLVTPTHYIYPILLALREAYRNGLRLPLVYNTNGYDSLELLELLDGIVDVYLPDMKYMDDAHARRYSNAPGYPETAKRALIEMYRQTGPVVLDEGIAQRGLIVRHLVLPNHLANTYDFLLWMKDAGLTDATLGLMSQYAPQHHALEF
ncbi:MAG: Radical protein, partial [Candidatus Hydrogenedentes bacterium]|nr:Radical protein [Candidatus Hydrogenedentota bacterium]